MGVPYTSTICEYHTRVPWVGTIHEYHRWVPCAWIICEYNVEVPCASRTWRYHVLVQCGCTMLVCVREYNVEVPYACVCARVQCAGTNVARGHTASEVYTPWAGGRVSRSVPRRSQCRERV